MSDTPEARPGAPRPAAATPARPPQPSNARLTPRAPATQPGPPAQAKPVPPPAASTPLALPPDDTDFFDDGEELRSSAVIPAAEELRLMPPPPPTPRAPSSAELVEKPRAPSQVVLEPRRPRAASSPDLAMSVTPVAPPAVTVSTEAQELLLGVLRNVLEDTLVPLLLKQQELEARLEALQRASVRPQPAAPSLAPVRSMAPSIDITGSLAPGATPRASHIMTSYGPVSVMPGPAPRPAMDVALENVGPIDMPDFAGKRKFAGRIIIGILILGVISAIVATVLSYS